MDNNTTAGNTSDTPVTYSSPTLIPLALTTSLLIVFGNLLTLVAIKRTASLQTKSNAFVASLAVADLCVGFMLLIYGLWLFPDIRDSYEDNMVICILFLSIGFSVIIVSLLNLLLVALDRWLFISYPFFYQRAVTNRVTVVGIAVPWIIGTTFGMSQWLIYSPKTNPPQCVVTEILPIFYYKYATPWFYFLPCIAIFIVYTRITLIAKKQQKRIQLESMSCQQTVEKTPPGEKRTSLKLLRSIKFNQKNWKAIKMMMAVFGVYFVCWTPRMFLYALAGQDLDRSCPPILFDLSLFLGFLNSGINFLVYPVHNREFRAAFKRILCCRWARGSQVQPSKDSIYDNTLVVTALS